MGHKAPIGIKVDGQTAVPQDPSRPEDQEAAFKAMLQTYGHVLGPLLLGDYPPSMIEDYGPDGTNWLPYFSHDEKLRLLNVKSRPDIIGLDIYSSVYAMEVSDCIRGQSDAWPSCVRFDIWDNNGKMIGTPSDSSWNFDYPHTVRVALQHVYETYVSSAANENGQIKLVVSENGVAVKDESWKALQDALNDDDRVAWYTHTITSIRDAIEQDGIPVIGLAAWSCIDNFEWAEGYRPRFGLIYVDRDTQVRTPKKSAGFMKRVFGEP